MFSKEPVLRLSMQRPRYPSERSLSHRWLPTNPAPPVTKARLILDPVLAWALATPEARVVYPGRPSLAGVQCVATVHDDFGFLHEGSGTLEVEGTDLFPLGDHYRRVRSRERFVGVKDDLHLGLGHYLRRGLARYGIVAHHPCIQRFQGSGYLQARGIPNVVGVGLESEAQQRYALPL